MGKHDNKSTGDGQGKFDPTRTKKVEDADGGRHSGEDKGGKDDKDDDKK